MVFIFNNRMTINTISFILWNNRVTICTHLQTFLKSIAICRLYDCGKMKISFIWLWMYRVKKKYRDGICQQITEFYNFTAFGLTISLLKIFSHWRLWDITVMCFTAKSCMNRKGFCRVITNVFGFCNNWQFKKKYFIVTLSDVEVKCILKHIQKYFI